MVGIDEMWIDFGYKLDKERNRMIALNHDEQWFHTAEGIAVFNKITTLEDRIWFMMEYLKSVIKESHIIGKIREINRDYEISCINETSSRLAIFLADAIYGSDLPYATYPALIDKNQNPFLAYWASRSFGNNWKRDNFYEKYSSIIYEENSKRKPGDAKSFRQQMLDTVGGEYAPETCKQAFDALPSTSAFDLTPPLLLIQLKNTWIFDRYKY